MKGNAQIKDSTKTPKLEWKKEKPSAELRVSNRFYTRVALSDILQHRSDPPPRQNTVAGKQSCDKEELWHLTEQWLQVQHTLCLTLWFYQILIALKASAESKGSTNKESVSVCFQGRLSPQTFPSLIFPCHPLWTQTAPWYKEIYEISFTSCISASSPAQRVSYVSQWFIDSVQVVKRCTFSTCILKNPVIKSKHFVCHCLICLFALAKGPESLCGFVVILTRSSWWWLRIPVSFKDLLSGSFSH